MIYPRELVEARLIRRYKRFLCDVRLVSGEVIVAHLANPGAMTSCLADDAPVRLLRSDDPKRKLAWGVEQIEVDGTWIVVNTGRANTVVGEALRAAQIPELVGYPIVEAERPYGAGSRVDFRLSGRGVAWVEVKTATMRAGGRALFPDARSERAIRHLGDLAGVVAAGDRGILVFAVGRGDVSAVAPANRVDPEYGRVLRAAVAAGVEVVAYAMVPSPVGITLGDAVPVELNDES